MGSPMKRCPFYFATLSLVKEQAPRLVQEWCKYKHFLGSRDIPKRVECGGDESTCPLLNDPTLELAG